MDLCKKNHTRFGHAWAPLIEEGPIVLTTAQKLGSMFHSTVISHIFPCLTLIENSCYYSNAIKVNEEWYGGTVPEPRGTMVVSIAASAARNWRSSANPGTNLANFFTPIVFPPFFHIPLYIEYFFPTNHGAERNRRLEESFSFCWFDLLIQLTEN
jgi:hypothetical protein